MMYQKKGNRPMLDTYAHTKKLCIESLEAKDDYQYLQFGEQPWYRRHKIRCVNVTITIL